MANATQTTAGSIRLAGDIAGSNDALAPQLTPTGVVPGSYTNPTVTIDAKGRITSAANGSSIDIFNIPTATASTLGVVKAGEGLSVSGDGTLSILTATTSQLGVVRIGTGLTVTNGLVSVDTALYPVVSNPFSFTGAVYSLPVTLSQSGSISLNFTASNTFDLTLTGNSTLAVPTNIGSVGGTYFIVIRQDGAGTRTLGFNPVFKFESGSPTTISTGANAISVLRATVVSATEIFCKLYLNFA